MEQVHWLNWVFPKCFHWIRGIHWENILHFNKIIRTCHLLCQRSKCCHITSKTHVEERIIKLNPIHASVIYQILWIHWISDQFRENSNVSHTFTFFQIERGTSGDDVLVAGRVLDLAPFTIDGESSTTLTLSAPDPTRLQIITRHRPDVLVPVAVFISAQHKTYIYNKKVVGFIAGSYRLSLIFEWRFCGQTPINFLKLFSSNWMN